MMKLWRSAIGAIQRTMRALRTSAVSPSTARERLDTALEKVVEEHEGDPDGIRLLNAVFDTEIHVDAGRIRDAEAAVGETLNHLARVQPELAADLATAFRDWLAAIERRQRLPRDMALGVGTLIAAGTAFYVQVSSATFVLDTPRVAALSVGLVGVSLCVSALISTSQIRQSSQASAGELRSLRRENARLAQQRDAAERVASEARRDIAIGFSEWAAESDRESKRFLALAILAPAVATGVGVFLVLQGSDLDTADVVTRLSVSIPGTIVSALLASESSTRRRHAQWGNLIAIQASHITDYVEDLHDDDQREIQRQFAMAVFRGGGALDDVSSGLAARRIGRTEKTPPAPADPLLAATQLVSLITNVAGADRAIADARSAQASADQVGVDRAATEAQTRKTIAEAEKTAAETEQLRNQTPSNELDDRTYGDVPPKVR